MRSPKESIGRRKNWYRVLEYIQQEKVGQKAVKTQTVRRRTRTELCHMVQGEACVQEGEWSTVSEVIRRLRSVKTEKRPFPFSVKRLLVTAKRTPG